jgi:hypothetical protein
VDVTMVEKGDKGFESTPPSSADQATYADIARPIVPHTTTITERDDDSVDDTSESELENRSQDTADTTVVDKLKVVGQASYDDSYCLVILAARVNGHELFCGYPKGSCPRPKHGILCKRADQQGTPGIYQQLMRCVVSLANNQNRQPLNWLSHHNNQD